jgi:hypothetical protein
MVRYKTTATIDVGLGGVNGKIKNINIILDSD